MAIVLYSTFLQFPGGSPAANYPVSIWPRASNQMALLFTSQDATTSAPNPLTTDVDGQAVFWAAPGDYVALLAGDRFGVHIDDTFTDPVWPGLWIHEQESASSVWTVAHHFGIRPQVEVILSGESAEAAVSHTNSETTVITFGSPQTGTAYLRR